jgi:hypothetical protein
MDLENFKIAYALFTKGNKEKEKKIPTTEHCPE